MIKLALIMSWNEKDESDGHTSQTQRDGCRWYTKTSGTGNENGPLTATDGFPGA